MTESVSWPRMILCLPGNKDFPVLAEPILRSEGVQYEFREADPRMMEAFQASACRVWPSLKEEDYRLLRQHQSVTYLLSPPLEPDPASDLSFKLLRVGRRLLENGAWGMKCESSGIAHSKTAWMELVQEADAALARAAAAHEEKNKNQAVAEFWSSLFRALVRFPIQWEDDLYSCGMHLLGRPDLIVSERVLLDALQKEGSAAWDAVDLFLGFGVYLLAECSRESFKSGHTFRLGANDPRFQVSWEPCSLYAEEEWMFNPYGRWRFEMPGKD